jgi:glutathione synthase/RimK-type ligase-like ATP-grasp enzyme
MDKKRVIISARQNHEVIDAVLNTLIKKKSFELILHDPQNDFFNLSEMPSSFKDVDLIIVKVRNECSLDLLHYAKIHNIPTLHDIDTVLVCKNKIALDYALREAFNKNPYVKRYFSLPKSWNHNVSDLKRFKKWAEPKIPIVIKSHYQHDKFNRFNFLVKKVGDIEKFCEMYKNFTYYDVYIQEFIECDGIERKIYVVGDKVFGIKRENPIYVYLRNNPNHIDVDNIQRSEFEITLSIKKLAQILARELNLKIFGFDLIKPLHTKKYFLVDLNDFPGFKGIQNIEMVLADYLKEFILNL